MNVPDWKPYACKVLAAVDPTAGPVYLLSFDEAREAIVDYEDRIATSDVAGIGGAALTAALRPMLESRGEWTGYGPAAVVDPRLGVIGAASVAIHEFVHWVDDFRSHDIWRDHVSAPLRVEGIDYGPRHALPVRLDDGTDVPPWLHHGPRFIRLCAHAAWRARQAGWSVWFDLLCDPTLHGLSRFSAWRAALGDEPERLAGLPMVEVAASALPAPFVTFSGSDVMRAERESRAAA